MDIVVYNRMRWLRFTIILHHCILRGYVVYAAAVNNTIHLIPLYSNTAHLHPIRWLAIIKQVVITSGRGVAKGG